MIRSEETDPIDLLSYKSLIKNFALFHYMENTMLLDIAHFMGLRPITGIGLINKFLGMFGRSISINAPGI
jgi:hypothetical protein